jgi:hypothetical protein
MGYVTHESCVMQLFDNLSNFETGIADGYARRATLFLEFKKINPRFTR